MTPKRPRDPNRLAKSIIDIATGEKPDRDPDALQFVVRKWAISGGYYVQILKRGVCADRQHTGFAKEHEAVEWTKDKSAGCGCCNKKARARETGLLSSRMF